MLVQLKEAKYIALTSDIWTCSNSNRSYISVTAHHISNDFIFKHGVLNISEFPGHHTGENIALKLKALIDDWKITKDKIYLLLRDSGSNMKKGARDFGVTSESCFIHTLQLVVTDSINSQQTIVHLIAKCRKIVTHFNHSSLSCGKLRDIQVQLNMPIKKLIQDVQTRWNSTYYLLERLQEQKRPLSLFAAENDSIQNLTAIEWNLLENCVKLLAPFEQITEQCSKTESIISEVIPSVCVIKRCLDDLHFEDPLVEDMKGTLIYNLNLASRFGTVQQNPHFCNSTFLDPRFKLNFFDENVKENVKNGILKLNLETSKIIDPETSESSTFTVLNRNQNDADSNNTNNNNDSQHESETESNSTSDHEERIPLALFAKRTKTVWDAFKEIAQTKPATQNSNPSEYERLLNMEVEQFLNIDLLDRKDSPILWWKEHYKQFPKLSQICQKYLCSPPSSVYSEKIFSEAGNVFDAKRNRLSSDNGEKLIFLHHNAPLLNYEY